MQKTEELNKKMDAHREYETANKQLMQKNLYEKVIFANKKFKVLYRHLYSMLEQLATAPVNSPDAINKVKQHLQRLLEL